MFLCIIRCFKKTTTCYILKIQLVDWLFNLITPMLDMHFHYKCITQLVTDTWLSGQQLLSLYKTSLRAFFFPLQRHSGLKRPFIDNTIHTWLEIFFFSHTQHFQSRTQTYCRCSKKKQLWSWTDVTQKQDEEEQRLCIEHSESSVGGRRCSERRRW